MTAGVQLEPSRLRGQRRAWYVYDWANSAFTTSVTSVFLGPYLGSIARAAADSSGHVYPFGIPVAAGSVFAYSVSVSVVLSVVFMPLIGALADRSSRRMQILAGTAYLGSAATILLVFATGDRYLFAALLYILANVCFQVANVVYYSYLPLLAEPAERDAVSSKGWASGYLGGGLLLLLNVIAVLIGPRLGWQTGDIARWSIVSAGIWWAVFTTIPASRISDELLFPAGPAGQHSRGGLLAGFRELRATLAEARGYPITLAFLVSFLIYNDGIQTVIAVATVYGTDALKLSQQVLVPAILMVQALAFVGALLMGRLAGTFGAKATVLGSLVLWAGVIGVAFALPARQPLGFIALAGVIGLVLGGSQALSRSLFSHLIPPGREAQYYSLYTISDNGTSWVGPLVFGLALQLTGNYRLAIAVLLVFFVIGFLGLLGVPVRRGIAAVGNEAPGRI